MILFKNNPSYSPPPPPRYDLRTTHDGKTPVSHRRGIMTWGGGRRAWSPLALLLGSPWEPGGAGSSHSSSLSCEVLPAADTAQHSQRSLCGISGMSFFPSSAGLFFFT